MPNLKKISLLILIFICGGLLTACGDATATSVGSRSTSVAGQSTTVVSPTSSAITTSATNPTTPAATTVAPSLTTIAATTSATGKDTLTLGVSRNLVEGDKDPYFTHNSLNVWESLTFLDNNLNPQPALAEKWTQAADGLSWTFNIRKNVKFSDGTPLDAKAVVFNIERLLKLAPRTSPFFSLEKGMKVAYGDLKSVEATDDFTVRFNLNAPAPALPAMLANFFSMVQAPSAFNDALEFKGLPVATGPYRLTEWKKDQFATLEANPNYWGTTPKLKTIRLRVIPDANARLAALKAGEVDALTELGSILPEQANALRSDSRFELNEQLVGLTHYLTFNGTKPPFNDVRLRQAVNAALDRDSIVKNILYGYGRAGGPFLTPVHRDWSDSTIKFEYNLERAKMLFAETGAKPATPILMLISGAQTGMYPYKPVAELLQSQLAKVGFQLEIKILDGAAFNPALQAGDYNLVISTQGLANGDPDYLISRYLTSKATQNTGRKMGYNNPKVDKLAETAAKELDNGKRREMYRHIQQIVAQEVPIVPVYYNVIVTPYRKGVTNLTVDPSYKPTLPLVTFSS
jgi:peptide/nickel transport system substrate-binding protein